MQYTGNELLLRVLERSREIREGREKRVTWSLSALTLVLGLTLTGLLSGFALLPGRTDASIHYQGSIIITKDGGTMVLFSAVMFALGVAAALVIIALRPYGQVAHAVKPAASHPQLYAQAADTREVPPDDPQF